MIMYILFSFIFSVRVTLTLKQWDDERKKNNKSPQL